jgi:hypothetical protein
MNNSSSNAQSVNDPLEAVRNIVAIGAGKGGVGKSTVAALLALGLHRKGCKVGLLDADVCGPSLPKITGTEGAQALASDEGLIIPPEKHGIDHEHGVSGACRSGRRLAWPDGPEVREGAARTRAVGRTRLPDRQPLPWAPATSHLRLSKASRSPARFARMGTPMLCSRTSRTPSRPLARPLSGSWIG